ncbi:MAG: phosphatidylserine decarboxylase family protein [Chlorobi bacterium]|nr:phosphatidylserine decarboxylase family protein [Chlorobiota bacterium]
MAKTTIHREGYPAILVSGLFLILLNTALFLFSGHSEWKWIILAGSIFTLLWICLFFRNPERKIIPAKDIIYAPADGTIVAIEKTVEAEYFGKEMLQISIFMSAFDIHVNRYPIDGIVKFSNYSPGRHFMAFNPKSSGNNERHSVAILHSSGQEIMVRQIAGAIARRIVNYAHKNSRVSQGNELGFIKFGSRVDLFLPTDCLVEVELNRKVYGNKTVIARFIHS